MWNTGAVCALVALFNSVAAGAATIHVPAGGNLQAALDAAQGGDVIMLAPGATYIGNFLLRAKAGVTAPIVLRTGTPDAALPAPGVRMTPAYASLLAKIKSPNNVAALRTAAGAHHWTIMLLEFSANAKGYHEIISLGRNDSGQTTYAEVPYQLRLDRLYVHGDPLIGQRRGIGLNSRDTEIVNSWVSDCKAIGQDSQAIGGANGPGNYLIENNYLEGAGENFMIGGSDPPIPDLVTTNVVFRLNHLRKPLQWRDPILPPATTVIAQAIAGGGSLPAGTYAYRVVARGAFSEATQPRSSASAEVVAAVVADGGAVTIGWAPVNGAVDYLVYGRAAGTPAMYWTTASTFMTDTGSAGAVGTPANGTRWSVKNLFELKSAQDVLIEGNVMENLWIAAQPGYSVVFTPRNQNGGAPWVVVQRVVFQHNIVRHTSGGVNILGRDNVRPSQVTNDITIQNNLFDDMTGAWGAGPRFVQLGDGVATVTIDHNTVMTTQYGVVWVYGEPSTNVRYTNNMSRHNAYGIMASGRAYGTDSITASLPGSVVSHNVLAGGSAARYPAGNLFPSTAAWVGEFEDFAVADYRLKPGSWLRSAGTDGTAVGADLEVINRHAAIALNGDSRPAVDPIQILTTALPDGHLNEPYVASLTCTGGSGTCGWAISEGGLPQGLSLDAAAGTISGTPASVDAIGQARFNVQAFDPAWPTTVAERPLLLEIAPPVLSMTMPPAADGQVGVSYRLTPSVSGVVGTVSWSVSSGILPAGLALDFFSGEMTGTPTAWGTASASVRALDSWGTNRQDENPVLITIAPAQIDITSTSLTSAQLTHPYFTTLRTEGGTGDVTWSVIDGALPVGMVLDDAGISGTPSQPGLFTFTVKASDANWPLNVATRTLSLLVDTPTAIVVSTTTLRPATTGILYQTAFSAVGGTGTAFWSLASGVLPSGLTLDAVGILRGTPLTAGTFPIAVRVVDGGWAANTATAALMLVVSDGAVPRAAVFWPEIVLHAADAATVVGNWSRVEDATAAGGFRMANRNLGAAKLAAPLPDPAHYFEVTFRADAGVAYHLWLRGTAEKNSWTNDSVFVQFSGVVSGAGAPLHRIGTTSATAVTLEDAANAGVSGWGWQDNALGTLAAPLYFAVSGPQTVRIQVREDGLSIDQIVLSSSRYATTAPGALKNDATVLAATVTADPREIVLFASDATSITGAWSLLDDATAAGGVRLRNPDLGAAKITSAAAQPSSYFEITFYAAARVPYHVWVRGKAEKNLWVNDSVYVQFSGTVDEAGSPRHRIGTTGAATLSIEDTNGAGLSGWGWQDSAWGGLAAPMYFAESGLQTIRVQVREDGLSIDQIALSIARYLTVAPGALKNDTTILVR
jgi:hypothetical protein